MAKTVGVLLSGCGVMDGSEIHEAVLTLLFVQRAGANALCMAPSIPQLHVINHLKNEPWGSQSRNVLEESARIARGDIKSIGDIRAAQIDALVLPGGYGAAKNLCTYATKGVQLDVEHNVDRLIRETHDARKPIGFICIAPVIAAKIFGPKRVHLTIGNDRATAADIEQLGAVHESCPVDDCRVDKALKIVSTPAYMLARNIDEAARGIEKLVQQVLAMA